MAPPPSGPLEVLPVPALPARVVSATHAVSVPSGTAGPSKSIRVSVLTLTNKTSAESALDIVIQHATGVPKETYLPIARHLFALLGDKLHSVVLHDVRNHGDSALLNNGLLPSGDAIAESGWNWPSDAIADAQTMLEFLNLPAKNRPLVGFGHSMGGALLTMVQLQRPVFSHLILVEPIIFAKYPPIDSMPSGTPTASSPAAQAPAPAIPKGILNAAARRASFPSVSAARSAYENRPFFKSWHPECFNEYISHGLHESNSEWLLKTTPEQEGASFKGGAARIVPVWKRLGEVRSRTLVISGKRSHHIGMRFADRGGNVVTKDEAVASHMSGAHIWFDASHMVCQDMPFAVAKATSDFLVGQSDGSRL